jgi:hypothetical protein
MSAAVSVEEVPAFCAHCGARRAARWATDNVIPELVAPLAPVSTEPADASGVEGWAEELLTEAELAAKLGVSRSTLAGARARGELRGVWLGRWKYRPGAIADYLAFLEDNCRTERGEEAGS